ncbi:MAG: hypothetical protein NT154_16500 [Verrucomicrobia bacterium]|nr:hypothetical protein [Verrucomicrobiota bacterium]
MTELALRIQSDGEERKRHEMRLAKIHKDYVKNVLIRCVAIGGGSYGVTSIRWRPKPRSLPD